MVRNKYGEMDELKDKLIKTIKLSFLERPEDISNKFDKDDVDEFYNDFVQARSRLEERGLTYNGSDKKLGFRISFTKANDEDCKIFIGTRRKKTPSGEREYIRTENQFTKTIKQWITVHSDWEGGRYFFNREKGKIYYKTKELKCTREILFWNFRKTIRRKRSSGH